MKLGGAEKWRVVWLVERVNDTWEKKVGNERQRDPDLFDGRLSGVGYSYRCDCRREDSRIHWQNSVVSSNNLDQS